MTARSDLDQSQITDQTGDDDHVHLPVGDQIPDP
jgi:hypothetical protein